MTVNYQIIYDYKDGKNRFYTTTPKTKKSKVIPIQEGILKIMLAHKQKTFLLGTNSGFEVDGYYGFVFINSKGNLPTPGSVDCTLRTKRDNYNKVEAENAAYGLMYDCDNIGIIFPAEIHEVENVRLDYYDKHEINTAEDRTRYYHQIEMFINKDCDITLYSRDLSESMGLLDYMNRCFELVAE